MSVTYKMFARLRLITGILLAWLRLITGKEYLKTLYNKLLLVALQLI